MTTPTDPQSLENDRWHGDPEMIRIHHESLARRPIPNSLYLPETDGKEEVAVSPEK